MGTQSTDSLLQLIQQMGLKEGNQILDVNGNTMAAGNSSVPLYADASGNFQAGAYPFAIPFVAAANQTTIAALSIEGQSTGTANDLMHQTLVQGSNVTTFTSQGFIRVAITDDAGNITNGFYYIQVGTLS